MRHPATPPPVRPYSPVKLAAFGLVALTVFAFFPVVRNDFVDYDDQIYITRNPRVTGGLTGANVTWAATTQYAGNWHPLTWWSLQLDATVFGVNPVGFHLTNLSIHVASVLLLFGILLRTTGAVWPAAIAAAVFAVHPLRVESVAWAAERKDVLATFFWMLTLLAYVRYARVPGVGRYLLSLLSFAVGLTAKPMLVTLPCVFLLFDYWPLNQLRRVSALRLLLEKSPFFALVAAASIVTLSAQQVAIHSLDSIPANVRIANAIYSYATYLGDFFLPAGLAVFYPHPRVGLASPRVLASAVVLIAITVVVIRQAVRRPYLLVGWLWYLGTMVPVIGLVQVGGQGRADRYTYVPLVGITVAIVYLLAEFAKTSGRVREGVSRVGVVVVMLLAVATAIQLGFWRDTVSLWTHTLAVTTDNAEAHRNLAVEWERQGNVAEAVKQYEEALKTFPAKHVIYNDLGALWMNRGDFRQAQRHFEAARAIAPDDPQTLNNLGGLLIMRGRAAEAEPLLTAAARGRADDPLVRFNLALAYTALGRWDDAVAAFDAGGRLDPENDAASHSFGVRLRDRGRIDLAIPYLRTATDLRPDDAERWFDLGMAYDWDRQYSPAAGAFRRAVAVDDGRSAFRTGLAHSTYQAGDKGTAAGLYRDATARDPDWVNRADEQAWRLSVRPDESQRNGRSAVFLAEQVCQATDYTAPDYLDTLAAAYAEAGRFPEAINAAKKAIAKVGANPPLEKEMGARLRLYEAGTPFRAERKR